MPKRQKPSPAKITRPNHSTPVSAAVAGSALVANPPAKNPTLLGVSILLFSLWFLYLFVAAFWG